VVSGEPLLDPGLIPGNPGELRWRRVLRVPELGLLLVILVLGASLALAAPRREFSERMVLPADAWVMETDGRLRVTTRGGVLTMYLTSQGYRVTPDGRGIIRTTTINTFLSRANLVGVAKDASFFAVMAVGVTGVIILGGIDLSVGSVYALAGVVGAMALRWLEARHAGDGGAPGWLTIPVGLLVPCLVGVACGLFNGLGSVWLRVHPFIITLGGMAVYRGLAFAFTQGQSIAELPDSFIKGFVKADFVGVNPVPMVVMLLVTGVGALFLSRSVKGRQSFAVGGNETAARYAGVPVGGVKVMWYVLCGLLAGLAGSMMIGYYGSASSDSGQGYELRVIASAVVGGASLSGGRGSAIGAMLGAVVIQLIDNGIVLLGLSQYTNIVIGLAIVLAVVVDQGKARFARGGP
jgi:ribose/xylose/arabinose/galactoside ABC-type transport system permease subunit